MTYPFPKPLEPLIKWAHSVFVQESAECYKKAQQWYDANWETEASLTRALEDACRQAEEADTVFGESMMLMRIVEWKEAAKEVTFTRALKAARRQAEEADMVVLEESMMSMPRWEDLAGE